MNVLPLLSTALAAAGVLGVTVAVLIGARARGVIDLQKAELDTIKGKVGRLDEENRQLRDRVGALEADKRALAELATGAHAIAALADASRANHGELVALLSVQHTEAMAAFGRIERRTATRKASA